MDFLLFDGVKIKIGRSLEVFFCWGGGGGNKLKFITQSLLLLNTALFNGMFLLYKIEHTFLNVLGEIFLFKLKNISVNIQ